MSKTQEANKAQVTLFSLGAAAKSHRSPHDIFRMQHTEAATRQTYHTTGPRVVSHARMHRLSKKYSCPASSPFGQPGDHRVEYVIAPERFRHQKEYPPFSGSPG